MMNRDIKWPEKERERVEYTPAYFANYNNNVTKLHAFLKPVIF